MRLWSIHPKYLDAAGLVALWREGLLAQAVLRGRTKGYRAHPQLARFRAHSAPVAAIATYLAAVQREATARGYAFDAKKIARPRTRQRITVTDGQIRFEWEHLMKKLARRGPAAFREARTVRTPDAHPLFRVANGRVCNWERTALGAGSE